MITVDGATKLITIAKMSLTLVPNGDSPESSTTYSYDLNNLWLDLNDWSDGEVGMVYDTPHQRVESFLVAGTQFAPFLIIINGYRCVFEDGQYTVLLEGANTNVFDVRGGILVQNQVQVVPSNSAGLAVTDQSGLTPAESAQLALIRKLLANEMITDPGTGVLTIYDDDDATPLVTGDIFEDVAESQPYRGRGIERRKRLT